MRNKEKIYMIAAMTTLNENVIVAIKTLTGSVIAVITNLYDMWPSPLQQSLNDYSKQPDHVNLMYL